MDAIEHRLIMAEERIVQFRMELDYINNRQTKTEDAMAQNAIMFERQNNKIDSILNILENGRKNGRQWIMWIPAVISAGTAVLMYLKK